MTCTWTRDVSLRAQILGTSPLPRGWSSVRSSKTHKCVHTKYIHAYLCMQTYMQAHTYACNYTHKRARVQIEIDAQPYTCNPTHKALNQRAQTCRIRPFIHHHTAFIHAVCYDVCANLQILPTDQIVMDCFYDNNFDHPIKYGCK